MTAETAGLLSADELPRAVAVGAHGGWLRRFVIAGGLGWAILFILVGVAWRLQLYGDGSIFSYSVAVRAGWAFHFRDIASRLFVFVSSHLPAETYVALTGDARGGIALYGLLFFAAPLAGLLATLAADRSGGRVIFCGACLSTAALCPMVFGFPTEMWIAHSVFWPALALSQYARRGLAGGTALFATLLALAFTHEGGLVLAVVIVATVALRGVRDAAFLRAAGTLVAVLVIWVAVRVAVPPEDYYARIIPAAAFNFIDATKLLTMPFFVLLLAALASYAAAFMLLRRQAPRKAAALAGAVVALGLAVYWLWFDRALHTQDRYYVRTAILFATPVLGGLAALCALRAEGALRLAPPVLARLANLIAERTIGFAHGSAARGLAGALALLMLAHAVETTKFVAAWSRYESALKALAMGQASDPGLGNPRFVSSERLGADLNRLSWSSTTHFLSVLVAPNFTPARLVVDPTAGYFWLTCAQASASEKASLSIPVESRRLIRLHACLHR